MNSHASSTAGAHFKTASTLTMTPGRCRDLDQDMHALRLSRQDNPFVQKVLASRESLIDTLDDQSDDAILMAAEEINPDCEDPLSMLSRNEVKEHMIRSPPPTSWPRSPQYMFTFNQDNNLTISSHSSDVSGPGFHWIIEDNIYREIPIQFQEESGFNNNHHSMRAHDLFLRTTSVPAQGSRMGGDADDGNNGTRRDTGLNSGLSRPKSRSVNMSNQYGGLSTTGTSELDTDMPNPSPSSGSMILRPQCLFEQEEGTGMRRFK